MSNNHDDKAMEILEKAIYYAQEQLEKRQKFQPFAMVLNENGNIDTIENSIKDSNECYESLGETVKGCIAKDNIEIMVMVVDTLIPDNFSKEVPNSIRVHLEERSQIDKKIAARFLYVPYTLHKVEEKILTKLHIPIPVGFPAEYIVNSK